MTAAELNEAPGPRRIKERISLLVNIRVLRWKFQVVVMMKKKKNSGCKSPVYGARTSSKRSKRSTNTLIPARF